MMMSRGGWLLAATVCILASWQHALVSADILLPPVKDGVDVGVGIIGGAEMLPEQYVTIAEELQDMSDLQLWIYISAGPVSLVEVDQIQAANETYTGRARAALVEAGLPPDAPYVAIGHSMVGGTTVSQELKRFPDLADACVMWAGHVTIVNLEEFPVPAQAMTGDLDAFMKVTVIAQEFDKLQELVENTAPYYKYHYPVVFLEGVNHVQYATGDMPAAFVEKNIVPEVSDGAAREIVNYFTNTFLTYWTDTVHGEMSGKSEWEMDQWYEQSKLIAEPILEVQRWEEDSDLENSYWVEEAQRYIAAVPEEHQHKLLITNQVVPQEVLPETRASLEVNADGNIDINTTTSVVRVIDDYVSAFMLESKMKSHESLMEALDILDDVTDPPPVTCRHVNDFAFQRVWELMSELQRSRFLNSGVEVVLEQDIEQFWGPGWVAAELVYQHCNNTLTVQGTSLWTSIDVEGYTGGVHYCKMMSPARAMEFMLLDSLRENPPTCTQ